MPVKGIKVLIHHVILSLGLVLVVLVLAFIRLQIYSSFCAKAAKN